LASPTNRRESPHKLSVSVFKERHRCAGLRCLPSCFRCRQKRNSNLLFSFRQSPRFLFRGNQLANQAPRVRFAAPFLKRHPLRGRRILLSRFWPSTPFEFLFSKCWRPVESASPQPVFQPAPAAKGAHITHRFQGVNTCRELFLTRHLHALNRVACEPHFVATA